MRLRWRVGRRGRGSGSVGLRPGRKLGRYELLGPLGAGGMADVWKARTVGPGGFQRLVVIKCIRPAHRTDPEFVRLFVDEATILGLLHHPNVVQVHEFADEDGELFLALEFVDGPSVSRVLRALHGSGRKMPPAIAAYIAREVCRALDYVHKLADADGRPLAIVHRDVTPSNIVFTTGGGIKLLDFGVAKFRRSVSLTRTGTVRGKPAYLAPEQIEGGVDDRAEGSAKGKTKAAAIDGRVDVFALGIVLHEMLSLEHLFAGDGDLITVKKVLEMEIPRPSSRSADIPAELDAIVMKALERDRDRRYGSAAEMARDLDQFVVGSRLRIDDVMNFVRMIEAETACPTWAGAAAGAQAVDRAISDARSADSAPILCAPAGPLAIPDQDTPTQKELALPARVAALHRRLSSRTRRRAGAIAGMALAAALAIAFGLRVGITTSKGVARAAEPSSSTATCAPP